MAFWNKKSLSDILIKSFKNENINYTFANNVLSFEYPIKNNILYPYITFDEEKDEASILINIKKGNEFDLKKINEFNIISRYFKACYKDDLIYLNYNFKSNDEIFDELNKILGTLNALIDEIANL